MLRHPDHSEDSGCLKREYPLLRQSKVESSPAKNNTDVGQFIIRAQISYYCRSYRKLAAECGRLGTLTNVRIEPLTTWRRPGRVVLRYHRVFLLYFSPVFCPWRSELSIQTIDTGYYEMTKYALLTFRCMSYKGTNFKAVQTRCVHKTRALVLVFMSSNPPPNMSLINCQNLLVTGGHFQNNANNSSEPGERSSIKG